MFAAVASPRRLCWKCDGNFRARKSWAHLPSFGRLSWPRSPSLALAAGAWMIAWCRVLGLWSRRR
eukprot:9485694-Pyramimonas_sp.AAC.1